MKMKNVCVSLALVFGAAGACCGVWMERGGFEADTGFAVAGHPSFWVAGALAAALFLLALVWCRFCSGRKKSFHEAFGPSGRVGQVCQAAAVVLMAGAGAAELFAFAGSGQATLLVDGLLSLFVAGAFGVLMGGHGRRAFTDSQSFYALVPVFWACYRFMLTFKDNAANPVLLQFIVPLFAGLFIMLSFYRYAALFYRRRDGVMLNLFSSMAVYFSLLWAGASVQCLSVGKLTLPNGAVALGMLPRLSTCWAS